MLIMFASLVAEAQDTLAAKTVNPAAVQFKDVREISGMVCGQLNSPNRAGGYDGFQPFFYQSKTRWAVGWTDGLVMADGDLINMAELSRRQSEIMRSRLPTSRDVEEGDRINLGESIRLELAKRCLRPRT